MNIIIPQNANFFKKWYIVTSPADERTINVIKYYNYPNIEILYFDFWSNGKSFNKGGAIRYAQQELKATSNDMVLLLDSDICLPEQFFDIVKQISLKPNTLYGTDKRFDYYSFSHLKNKIIDSEYPYSQRFQGYFQMYGFD